jgi:Methyltransferase domain
MSGETGDRSTLLPYSDGSRYSGRKRADVFNEIAKANLWFDKESLSGPGSTIDQTRVLIQRLPAIFSKYKIKSLLDVPCGDFNWMQAVNLQGIEYTGADLVQKINLSNQRFVNEHRSFVMLDMVSDPLPKADLVFCRDCLVHFSFADIASALKNIYSSGSTYLMITTFPDEPVNRDIPTGGWRTLDFSKAPFCFPQPLELLNEACTELDGKFADKSMGLWRIDDLRKAGVSTGA